MSATTIIDTAPLGALIRYTDGNPKPPARFTKKLAAWERSNGVGRLVKKEPPRPYPTWTAPASFTLHEGNFSSDGVILVTIMRSHSADSRLVFEVAEEPKPGQVRVLLDFGGNTELLHLAKSITAAELWIAREGYSNARLEIVDADNGNRAGGADLAARALRMREGPAHGRASHRPDPRPAKSRGTKGFIPREGGLQPRACPGGWRRSRHQRDNRLLTFGHHPPLAIPFLAPNPVFEINPRGVGLRASPCRRVDSAPFEEGGRTHPVMSASLRACGVLSRGGWPPASQTGAKQMSRKDAHAFAASLAATLMVSIVVFQAGDGTFGAVPADEIDGDEVQVVAEVDPWA